MLRLLTEPSRPRSGVAVVGGLLAVALWPDDGAGGCRPPSRADRSSSRSTRKGVTRVRDRFVVSAPVTGRVLRIELEPGDRGQARAGRGAVCAPRRRRCSTRGRAPRRRRRVESATRGARPGPRRGAARARDAGAGASASWRAPASWPQSGLTTPRRSSMRARPNVQVAAGGGQGRRVRRARGRRRSCSAPRRGSRRRRPTASGRVVSVTAPVDGVVLRRVRESETVVPAGDPLLEIGDPAPARDRLGPALDRRRPRQARRAGDRRAVGRRAGCSRRGSAASSRPASRRSRRSASRSSASTSCSTSSIRPRRWAALGDAYRVEVRIVIWEAADVLKVPTSALFRGGRQMGGLHRRRRSGAETLVELGHQTGQEAEVLSGLTDGTRVILHPGDTLTDGARVEPRTSNAVDPDPRSPIPDPRSPIPDPRSLIP